MRQAEEKAGNIHPWIKEETVRMGVHFMDPCLDWTQYHDSVLEAEQLGFDSIWVADHPTHIADCWTTLATLAVTTKHIRLGTLVNCVFYRNPIVLARMAVDVDRWSNGRLVLGLGIGDIPAEFQQMGIPFLSTRERQEFLEETIQVVKGIWTGKSFTFHGKHIQLEDAHIALTPLQQPSIPLLIAGGGERVTLRQVAQYADMSNFGAHSFTGGAKQAEDVSRKCKVLRDYSLNIGRDPDSLLRSYVVMPLLLGKTQEVLEKKLQALPLEVRKIFQTSITALSPQDAVTYFRSLQQAGIQYFIVGVGLRDWETLKLLSSEVLPMLRATL